MAKRSFVASLKVATVAFITYVLSLMAAMSWNGAVQDYITSHNSKWIRWVLALVITVVSLMIIALIVAYVDDENDVQSASISAKKIAMNVRGKGKPTMGGMA